MHDMMANINERGKDVEVILDSESGSEVETSVNRNLQPLEGATSVVWKFFGFDVDKDGQILVTEKRKRTTMSCNRCKKKLKYTGVPVTYTFTLINTIRANTNKPRMLPWKNLVKYLVARRMLKIVNK